MITVNFIYLLIAILPALIYCRLIFWMLPKKTVSIRRARKYLLAGMLAPFLKQLLMYVFPDINLLPVLCIIPGVSVPPMMILHIAIFYVGFVETAIKVSVFAWVNSQRRSTSYDLPVATAFYMMLASTGFAVMENTEYLFMQGSNPLRAFTSIPMHMISGLIVGYFFAIAKNMKPRDIDGPPLYVELYRDYSTARKWFVMGLGICAASLYHGLYDANLLFDDHPYKLFTLVLTLMFGVAISYLLFRELTRESIKQRESKSYNDWELQ